MKIQEAFSNCCQGIKEFTVAAATWMGKTVTALGSFLAGIARKVAEFARPYFEQLRTFARENKQPIIVATIAFAVGAVVTAVINQLFCKATDAQPTTTTATASTV